jgi:tetratricopeptide (TPR) repeat protein|tara:strand:+ start:95 stop:1189 length:1095 start_codon:yes stop_codon:yes gene_type:complete
MHIIKNFFIGLILVSTLFAGQDLESAKIRLKDKEWDKAEEFLLKALTHPKDRWEAAFHLGDKIYPRSQDWAKVKEYMDIAGTASAKLKIRPTPNDRKIFMSQAIAASLTKSYNLIYYRASGFLGLMNKAKSIEQRDALVDQAIETSIQAKELDPSQPGSYALLGLYYSVKGDKENTFKYIDQALSLPDIPEDVQLALLVSAGQSAVRLQDFNRGLNYYESALEINPNEVPALKSLGALYLAKDEFEPALKNLDAAIEFSEDDKEKVDLFFNRGLVYLRMNEFEEAEYNFEEAYFLAPDDMDALFGLARALEEAERWRKARTYYLELIDSDPEDARYYFGVYRTYFGEGRLEDATEYLNKANALK